MVIGGQSRHVPEAVSENPPLAPQSDEDSSVMPGELTSQCECQEQITYFTCQARITLKESRARVTQSVVERMGNGCAFNATQRSLSY